MKHLIKLLTKGNYIICCMRIKANWFFMKVTSILELKEMQMSHESLHMIYMQYCSSIQYTLLQYTYSWKTSQNYLVKIMGLWGKITLDKPLKPCDCVIMTIIKITLILKKANMSTKILLLNKEIIQEV